MRGGDLSLRPAGLEAKQGAQRAVGDRGQSPPSGASEMDGVQSDGQGQVAGEKSLELQGQTQMVAGTDGQVENGQMGMQMEDGNAEKRAMVGHLKAD